MDHFRNTNMSTILFLILILHLVSAGPVPIQTTNVTTWFQPGVGERSACPKLNATDDNTGAVALSTKPFANGTACHALIKIESSEGLTAYGRVTDLCPEPFCQAGDLNLSPDLFAQFAPLSNGMVTGLRWSFVNKTTSQPTSFIEPVISEVEPDPLLATSTVPAHEPSQTTPTSSSADNQVTPTPKAQPPTPLTTSISYPQQSPITTSTSTTYPATMTPKPDSDPFSGHITWYNPSVGIGACGNANTDDDYVIAVNSAQYHGKCGKRITINGNGKQVSAVVTDECPTCGFGDLDLSPAVFKNIAGLDVGKLPITWSFN